MDLQEKIKARAKELRIELERFVVQANQQVAVYQAAIAELEKILDDTQTVPPDKQ